MQAFHIHITGLVQGVGFRPWVHKLASNFSLDGYVNNGLDGVHIYCSGNEDDVNEFYQSLILHQVGEEQRLAAFARAGVPPRLAWRGGAEPAHQLG